MQRYYDFLINNFYILTFATTTITRNYTMKRSFLLFLIFCFSLTVLAQQFDFNPSVSQGCTPLLVTFTNTTDPTIIADYRYEWVVEPGKFSTETYQMENTYLLPGNYMAQMKVFDLTTEMLVETVSKPIIAFRDPDVQIASDKEESCVYKPFQFSITATESDAPLTSYMWILSDGTTYPSEVPAAHSFRSAGEHSIFCAVTDANGCTNRERHTITVKTYNDAPKTSISSDKKQTCDPVLAVQFANTSPADTLLDYFEWNFGDGTPLNTSTQHPSHTYNGYGAYTATLKNVSIHDCEASASVAIQLIDYKPDFTIADDGKTLDGTNEACNGTITFTGSATPASPRTISYSWAYESNPAVKGTNNKYTVQELSGGTKRMTLTVDNGVCERSITKTFRVETPLQISYTPTDAFYCEATSVDYTAVSNVPGSSFEWNINGSALTGNPVSYFFTEAGLYSDALTVITPNNCKDSLEKPNNIELVFPKIELSRLSSVSGCAPLGVLFSETRTYNTTRDNFARVEWDFDYEHPVFTVDATGFGQASWTHNLRGVYQTAVRAVTDRGCVVYDYAKDSASKKEIIKVGYKPSAELIFPDTIMCASELLKFTFHNNDTSLMNSGYDTLFISAPHWIRNRFGTPNNTLPAPGAVQDRELAMELRDSVGEHSVYYVLSDHGCRSRSVQDSVTELQIPTTIHLHGPILKINEPQKNCEDNYNYTYSFSQKINVDYSSPNQYIDWYLRPAGRRTPGWHFAHNKDTVHINFEDTVHTHFGFPDGRGRYEIYAIGYNGDEDCHGAGPCNCYDTVSVETTVTDIKADFIIDNPTPCLGDSTLIQIGKAAQDVDWNETYWLRNGEQFYADTAYFLFDDKNIQYIEVVTADQFKCADTMRIPLKVYKPEAAFKATIVSDCLPFTTEFSDTTRWDTDTTIVSRLWDFGSGTPSQGTDSVHTVMFDTEGFVSPSLKVTDILGCSDSLTVPDYIKPIVPNSKFALTTPKLCLNHEAIITRDFSDPYLDNAIHRFTWDFGDGTIITGDPASSKPEYIFADTVRHRYTQESVPGKFKVSLTAYSKSPIDPMRECKATTDTAIEVKDVSAHIQIRDMDKCKEPGQVFIVYIDDTWYRGKYASTEWNKIESGNTIIVSPASSIAPRVITFADYGMQTIELITHSDYYGCETDTAREMIEVPGYDVEFVADKHLVCVGEDVTFTRTRALNVERYTSYWSFGDGVQNYTDLEQAIHSYGALPDTENKRYKVHYIVDAPNTCKVDTSKYLLIELHPVEANFLRGIDDVDSIGCAPHTVEFINTSIGAKDNVFKWKFGDGSTSTEKNPTHTFTAKDTPYEVSLSIEGVACNDTARKKVYFYPVPDVQFDYDSVLCLGESSAITAQGSFSTIAWKPQQYFSNPNEAVTLYKPRESGMAYADITSLYGCAEHDSLFVYVQQRPRYQGAPDSALLYYRTPTEMVLTSRPDSKLIAGQIYNVNNTPVEGVMYEWSPADFLSCTDCVSPNIHLECGTPGYPNCWDFPYEIPYRISMYDTLGCFEEHADILFRIVVETKAAMPQAFTPNGDGNNDIAFVRGWGIKEFLEVRIYNRWGQIVFESNDLQHGWNGVYNGKDQPMETYSYTIRYVDTKDEEQFAKGYITLIR
ncbi:MAG: PKD domain-containing protein [Bacteroidales bacterium]|nr:PKD domain-containing protein [Bacteroidales bacterium]